MKLKKYTLLLVCSITVSQLSSCSSVGEHYTVGPLFAPKGTSAHGTPNMVNPVKIASGDFSSGSSSNFKAGTGEAFVPVGMTEKDFTTLYSEAQGANGQQKRNELARRLILISDTMAEKHLANTMGVSASMNVGSGTFTNLASGASVLFNPASTKSILAGFAGFSNAQRSLWNEEIYKNAFVDAIVYNMRKQRQNEWAKLKTGFSKTITEYPVDEMLVEVNKYHYSGSFAEGLRATVKKASRVKSNLEIDAMIKALNEENTKIQAGTLSATEKAAFKKNVEEKIKLLRTEQVKRILE